jgi:hypothetical protein
MPGDALSLTKGDALSLTKGDALSLTKGDALSLTKGDALSLPKGGFYTPPGITVRRIRAPQVPSPLDPDALLHAIQAMAQEPEVQGQATFPTYSVTWLAPAGGSGSLPLTLPAGWYGVHRSPVRLTSDYYHRDLTAEVLADGVVINPSPLALTGPVEVEWGEFYLKKQGIEIRVANGTAQDAYITMWVRATFLTQRLYDSFFRPLVRRHWGILSAAAEETT